MQCSRQYPLFTLHSCPKPGTLARESPYIANLHSTLLRPRISHPPPLSLRSTLPALVFLGIGSFLLLSSRLASCDFAFFGGYHICR